MALPRPLRLKSEKYTPTPAISQSPRNVALVWVDSGIYHCDQRYEYLIPEKFQELVSVGIRVVVPFNGRSVEAIVIERAPASTARALKVIEKVISPVPVATRQSLALIEQVAKRWAAHPFDVIRSAIPPRVASVDKFDWGQLPKPASPQKTEVRYLLMPPATDFLKTLAQYVKKNSVSGSRLILLPDSKTVEQLSKLIPGSLILDSQQGKEIRYRNFLHTLFHEKVTIIGTRSAIFAPSSDISEIVIFNDTSDLYYEPRSPGWNARDVARLRTEIDHAHVTFIGYSPSAELAVGIDRGECGYVSKRARVDVRALSQINGELLPSAAMKLIRGQVKNGPILFIAPRRGYSQAITCAQCRNTALCTCGGRLVQKSALSSPECAICSMPFTNWSCQWCSGKRPFLLQRGAARYLVEIGKSFPGVPITESNAEKLVEVYEREDGFVIATPGALPRSGSGFSAVVILDAANFLMQSDLRAQERARATFFEAAGRLSPTGQLLLILDPSHPIVAALASWKPSLISQRELREREEVKLPPFTRLISMEIETSESASLLRGLRTAQRDGRLPTSAHIHDPIEKSANRSRILMRVPDENAQELISLVHEFQRRRSSSGKPLATLRIDPYSIA